MLALVSYAAVGKNYDFTLPVVGRVTVDIPTEQLVKDAVDQAEHDLWVRTKSKLPYVLGLAAIGAAIWLLRSQKRG